jgi:hypothetical protein
MSTSEKVLVEVVVAASPQEVWRALRDPAEISRWFGWECDTLAEEVAYIFERATVVEEGRRLSFAETGDVFVVEPRGELTVLRVVRSAPAGSDWDGIYDDIVEGWRTFVQQLRFALGPQAAGVRRTLYFSGRSREHGPRPPAAIGLSTLDSVGVGERYSLQSGAGDTLTGTVWFRSAHQIGVTVDSFGNGLLIVHNRPKTDKSPFGGGMAVLTTYGLDDTAFDALRSRWTSWWESVFDSPTVQPAPHR